MLKKTVLRWLVDLFGLQRGGLQSFLALLCSLCILLFIAVLFLFLHVSNTGFRNLKSFNFNVVVLSPFMKR